MSEPQSPTEAERIELAKLFRAIAEFGRRVRQRRLAEAGQDRRIPSGKQTLNLQNQSPRIVQKRIRRKKYLQEKNTEPSYSDGTLKN